MSSTTTSTEATIDLHVDRFGNPDDLPVVMLHGWGSSAELMAAAGAPLAETHSIHNIDLPGHGRTPAPPEAWGVPEYAAAVANYIHGAGITGAMLIGHSNGGRIGLYLASQPETSHLFSRMVLVSPSGVKPDRPLSVRFKSAYISAIKAPFQLIPDGPTRRRGLDWLRTTIYWQLAASTDYRNADGVMRETFVRTVNHHLDDQLSHIRVPVLLVWGSDDTAVSERQMATLEREIPDAGLVVLENAGHYGYLDRPDVYAAALTHFVTA
ncbi:alpha/beta hydrolase [soil metagenome]